jgi:hypothetical protein
MDAPTAGERRVLPDSPRTPVPGSGGEVDLKSAAPLPRSVEDELRCSDVLGGDAYGLVQRDLVR